MSASLEAGRRGRSSQSPLTPKVQVQRYFKPSIFGDMIQVELRAFIQLNMINMNPLQLISVFLLFSPLFSAALHAKPGCLDRCGDLLIPYPFGVGQKCSLNPYFNIKCDTSTYPPRAYLSVMKKEVIEFNQTYIRLKNPYMISACYDLSAGSTGNQHSMSVNLSGTPYRFSNVNVLTAIGCDDMVLLSDESSYIGGCSAFCTVENDTSGIGNCQFNGCCHERFSGNCQSFPLSKNIERTWTFLCVINK